MKTKTDQSVTPLEPVQERLIGYVRSDGGSLLIASPEAARGDCGAFPGKDALTKLVREAARDRRGAQIPFSDHGTGAAVLVTASNNTHPVVGRYTASGDLVEARLILDQRYDWLPMPDDESDVRIDAALAIINELPPILKLDSTWKLTMLRRAGFTDAEVEAIAAKDRSGEA